jgi:hypothetical protein
MNIIFLLFIDRNMVRDRVGDGNERHYFGGGAEKTIYSIQKVPRHCPLVLLIGVKHMIGINYKFNFCGVRESAFDRNLIRN